MINVVICDDDIQEIKIISAFLSKNIEDLNISFKVTSFNDGQDLIDHMSCAKENFDIIFLDIYMKTSHGIDIAREIRKFDKECKYIFEI